METDAAGLRSALAAIANYSNCVRQQEEKEFQTLAGGFPAILSEIQGLRDDHERHLKETKARFNLFTLLWPYHYEVQLHSRYISHLLNPQPDSWDTSYHDCGPLFLDLFLEQLPREAQPATDAVEPLAAGLFERFDRSKAVVHREKHTGGLGSIDILIEERGWGAIAIENKIRAGDQDNQLGRYWKYLQQKYTKAGKNAVLLYLTPDGHCSAGAGSVPYYCISYAHSVASWIDACISQTVEWPALNCGLVQYKKVIEAVAGKSGLEARAMEKIVELVRKNPQVIRHFVEIREAVENIRKEHWIAFFAKVHECLPTQYRQWDQPFPAVSNRGLETFCYIRSAVIPENLARLAIGCDSEVFVGIRHVKPKKEEDGLAHLHTELMRTFQTDPNNGSGWLHYYYPDPQIGFTEEALSRFVSGEADLAAMAGPVAKKIQAYFQKAEAVWKQLQR